MSEMLQDTIGAIATAAGNAGVGVIRVSGSGAMAVLVKVFRLKNGAVLPDPKPRYLYFGKIVNSAGQIIDEVLVVYMPAPNSYTGEDVVEIQCHGGFVVTREILNVLLASGVVMAAPGEFSQRAFINGRLNLSQAEAIIDIIQAKSAAALKISEKQLAGALGQQVAEENDKLLDILAQIEVAVDYPEEEADIWQQMDLKGKLSQVLAVVQKLLQSADQGKMYREGVQTAIVGPANAGKSTLLNAFLQEERAIVTEVAGTTRDTIEEYCTIEGLPFKLIDTAGIRETADLVEAKGIARSRAALAAADLVLLMLDATEEITEPWLEILDGLAGKPLIVLLNKFDLCQGASALQEFLLGRYPLLEVLTMAAKENLGLADLKALMVAKVQLGGVSPNELVGLINNRQKSALERGAFHLTEAIAGYDQGIEGDMIAIDIQGAWQALGEITGSTTADDIISRVFSRFCLGK